MTHKIRLLWLLCSLAACQPQNQQVDARLDQAFAPVSGGKLRNAMSADARNLIPFIGADSASHEIAGYLFNSLLKYDKNLELTGDLAQSWQISPDGLTVTFKLRPDVRWSDGKALTSADVLFTFNTVIDPNTRTPYGSDYALVKSMATPDPLTVVVQYKEPFAPALSSWAGLTILPAHLLRDQDINNASFARRPIGSGFYTLKNWQPNQSIDLAANNSGFAGRPRIDAINYRIIPDDAAQFMEMEIGNLDQIGLNPIQYSRVLPAKTAMQKRLATYKYLGNNYTYLGFNLKSAPFNDRRVRLAINYAVDKQEIIRGVLLGQGLPLAAPFKPGTRWYPQDLQPYPYDPEKAKRLLAEAGWRDHDGDGMLDRDGKRLEIRLITNSGNELRALTAALIQRRLKSIGIDVQIRIYEWAAFLSQFVDTGNFDAIILGWSLSLDPDQFSIWHSSEQGPGKFNFLGYNNPAVDKLLEQGRREMDLDKRTAIYHQFSRLLYQDSPMIYLYAPYSLVAVHKRIRGIEPAPAGISHNYEQWYIPTPFQKNAIAQ